MPASAAADKSAFTVAEFCTAHGISRSLYYELKRAGLGPVEMRLRNRRAISVEAAAAWRKAREAEHPIPQS